MEAMIASHGGGLGVAREDTLGPPYGLFNVRSLGIQVERLLFPGKHAPIAWDSDLWGILAKAFIRTCPRS